MNMSISKTDEITMRLVHYFVTVENYQPIVVNGLENEIWLENLENDYRVIRINANYIHNQEQLEFDEYKAKSIIKQIKKKTLSFKINYLTILLDANEDLKIDSEENKNYIAINEVDDINKKLINLFPTIKNDNISSDDAMDFFIKVTNDINESTERKSEQYEKTFGKKFIFVTYLLIAINVIIFILQLLNIVNSSQFGMNSELVRGGQYYRLITSAFLHGGIIHLLCNMYSLFIIGTQLETVLGKVKFTIVYFLSIIASSLLSGVINAGTGIMSVGASGAIFGLLGALLYFGYHYRLYLGNAIVYQILPVIGINLIIGFTTPGIDNWAHLGGLAGGYLAGMIVGINDKKNTVDRINGIIVSILLYGFLTYMLLFR